MKNQFEGSGMGTGPCKTDNLLKKTCLVRKVFGILRAAGVRDNCTKELYLNLYIISAMQR